MAKSWYAFIRGEDPTDAQNYFRITIKHSCLCGTKICAIYAADDGIHPLEPLSKNIQQYISDALTTTQLQPEFPYNTKKYVYLKD